MGHRLPWLGSQVSPQPLSNPRWLGWSDDLAHRLKLQADDATLALLSGSGATLPWSPVAQVYSGHQFGGYTPRLGDGRGLHLGEREGLEVFLKGSGQTPYSRGGDGRAVLRSAVREFLASEALFHLGIATTRALAVIGSDTPVRREELETGAITVRVSESHLRFGHFEYFLYTRQQPQLEALIEDTIDHHFAGVRGESDAKLAWLVEVVERTARTVADWQAFGFCHGVLNSDNMSILGETFDYGPFAFMNRFDPGYICNHSDHDGRYAFDQQAGIGLWNLNRLAITLTPWLDETAIRQALARYEPVLVERYLARMGARLGLPDPTAEDLPLIAELLNRMAEGGLDYSNTLREFAQVDPTSQDTPLHRRFAGVAGFSDWWQRYQQRLGGVDGLADWQARRGEANPALILRTHLAQEAISAAEQGDNDPLHRLHRALCRPYDPEPEFDDLRGDAPSWSQQLTLSCSS
ncbi:protein adenylyltransferase SelO [Ferrimonas balearica]|uniref:protein adenylyltransferase SelO n=1 Tax=Ferrimonas balearica TaxID=44012 RepID=UPI002D80348B|nr:YdiU family protein [Ferrimonas balearica]